MRKLLMVAAFPPPVHGLANASEFMYQTLSASGFEVDRHDVSPGSRKAAAYHFHRLSRTLSAAMSIVRLKSRPYALYLPLDGGLGIIYALILAFVAKISSVPIVFHHHSFAYIDKTSYAINLLLVISAPNQGHIFLCEAMYKSFISRYKNSFPGAAKVMTLQNGALFDNVAEIPKHDGIVGPICIGHMSNLSIEKGTDVFLELFTRLRARNVDITGVLAGPLEDKTLRASVEKLLTAEDGRFVYMGPVYGDKKTQFWNNIDVFIFPTRYKNEAQPIVLIESLRAARPFVTAGRGCICEDHQHSESLVVDDIDSFVSHAATWIEGRIELNDLKRRKEMALLRANNLSQKSQQELRGVIDFFRQKSAEVSA